MYASLSTSTLLNTLRVTSTVVKGERTHDRRAEPQAGNPEAEAKTMAVDAVLGSVGR